MTVEQLTQIDWAKILSIVAKALTIALLVIKIRRRRREPPLNKE